MRASHALLVVVLLSSATAVAQIAIRPGQYEVTFDLDLGIPKEGQKAVLDAAGLKGQKKLECFTSEDVKGGFWKMLTGEAEDLNCKPSNVKTTGNKMTFTLTCEEDDIRVITNTEMTFGADSFTGVTSGNDHTGRVTTSKFGAKRVGECKK